MNLELALQKGRGYARKRFSSGNRLTVEEVNGMLDVILKHRSGAVKTMDVGAKEHTVTDKYGAEGWQPGM